jgi:hypothetical protein
MSVNLARRRRPATKGSLQYSVAREQSLPLLMNQAHCNILQRGLIASITSLVTALSTFTVTLKVRQQLVVCMRRVDL